MSSPCSSSPSRNYGLWIPEDHNNIKKDFPEIHDVKQLVTDVRRVINEWFDDHKHGIIERSINLNESTLRAILKTKGIYLPDQVGFYY